MIMRRADIALHDIPPHADSPRAPSCSTMAVATAHLELEAPSACLISIRIQEGHLLSFEEGSELAALSLVEKLPILLLAVS